MIMMQDNLAFTPLPDKRISAESAAGLVSKKIARALFYDAYMYHVSVPSYIFGHSNRKNFAIQKADNASAKCFCIEPLKLVQRLRDTGNCKESKTGTRRYIRHLLLVVASARVYARG